MIDLASINFAMPSTITFKKVLPFIDYRWVIKGIIVSDEVFYVGIIGQ